MGHLKTGFSQRETPLKIKSLAGEQVFILYYIYLSIYLWGCAKVGACMYGRDQEGRGEICCGRFSPSTVWDPGTELKLSSLEVGTFVK